ncbi:MAG: hypothetical protein KBT03_11910 [Bacteroidales bacterium]|nr:hypothetical protein [Candidatus Scybalousia scybalohippi]
MANYSKQNFTSGQTLTAAQLNAMDAQILANEVDIKQKYEKPSTGIPVYDLSQEVQNKLNNAGSGSGSGSSVTVDSALSSTSTNPVQNKVITAETTAIKETYQALSTEVNKKYVKPSTGIPASDLSEEVQNKLNNAGSGSSVTVDSSLSTTSSNPVRNSVITQELNKKYVKPSTGIPTSDLASGVIPQALKNPNKITFTGAVSAEYDGSSPVSVNIPSGGGNSQFRLIYDKTFENVTSILDQDNIFSELDEAEEIIIKMYFTHPDGQNNAIHGCYPEINTGTKRIMRLYYAQILGDGGYPNMGYLIKMNRVLNEIYYVQSMISIVAPILNGEYTPINTNISTVGALQTVSSNNDAPSFKLNASNSFNLNMQIWMR